MTVFTSVNKKLFTKAGIIAVFGLLALALCVLIGFEKREAVKSFATCDEAGRYFTQASDAEAQRKFLRQFKTEVSGKPRSTRNVTIPVSFNDTYKAYEKLQEKIGLSLAPYKGREALEVTYRIKGEKGFVVLLIYRGCVIGGHRCTGVYGDRYSSLVG